jgi:hypothetical protein
MINGKYYSQLNSEMVHTIPFQLDFILHLIKLNQKKEGLSHTNLAVD